MAGFEIDLSAPLIEALKKVRERLEDPSPLMRRLGALGVASAQKAFGDQGLGSIDWPERYPNVSDDFLNVAGALQDFSSGRNAPKPNRFDRRPALVDEGQRGGMWGSLSFASGRRKIRWGTVKQYGTLHQEGGESVQPVTAAAKRAIGFWLIGERGKMRRAAKKKPLGVNEVSRMARWNAANRMKKLTKPNVTELVTQVHPRPFLGITDELEGDMIEAIRRYFRRKA